MTLLNLTGQSANALHCIEKHRFHPWEGGEGKISAQYVAALCALAVDTLQNKQPLLAEEWLQRTYTYPENLGEGKLYGAQENLQNYLMGTAMVQLGKKEAADAYFEKASSGMDEPQSAVYYNDQPPETIFCQGLALRKLGRKEEADLRFKKLIEYADRHLDDFVKIDYFAVSLPDFLVFDDDLQKKNRVHCLFMKALGCTGLGNTPAAQEALRQALALDQNHFALQFYKMLFHLGEK